MVQPKGTIHQNLVSLNLIGHYHYEHVVCVKTYQTKQISHIHLWVLILVDIQDGLRISIDRSTIARSMFIL